MPGMGGGKRGKQQPQRKKSKSGNPAKRAAEERAAAEKAKGAKAGGGSAFGSGSAGAVPDIDPAKLPAGFEKFLGR
jgi:signal recognition particle subunit SRP54